MQPKRETFASGVFACNTSVIYCEQTKKAIVVDPSDDTTKVRTFCRDHNLQVQLILHTHAHFDHIAGSHQLAQDWGCPFGLHEDDVWLYEGLPQQGQLFGVNLPKPGPVDFMIGDSQEFKEIDQTKITCVHTPGHTPGSVCFYTESLGTPLLLAGDTLFQGSIGRTDLPGGDSYKIIDSIKGRLLRLPEETIVVPGHGPMTTLAIEKKHNPYL